MIESKSLLAKLMATENLTIEQRKVPTASFNVKDRILVIPIMNEQTSAFVMDLFMGHEVGHALYTPLEGLMKSKDEGIISSVLNVVEDSRIERKIKYKYPGLKNCFIKAYSELVEKDFFGTNDKDLNELNFIDRVNMHCKGGAGLNIRFSHEERDLVRDIENTETYDDVIEVALKLAKYAKEEKEQMKLKMSQINLEELEIEDADDDLDDFEELDIDADFDNQPYESNEKLDKEENQKNRHCYNLSSSN